VALAEGERNIAPSFLGPLAGLCFRKIPSLEPCRSLNLGVDIRDIMPLRVRSRVAVRRSRGLYSGYQPRFRCFFIHVPRTGGNSIALTMLDGRSAHTPYFVYQHAYPDEFSEFFKFCFVRNPWDRLVSAFFYLKAGGMDAPDRRWAREHLAAYHTFKDFVHGWVNEANIWTWIHFLPQSYFVIDRAGCKTVDFVGRFECIERDFAQVAARLQFSAPLRRMNPSNHRHYTTYYDDETIAIVARAYASDIDAFGYAFADGCAPRAAKQSFFRGALTVDPEVPSPENMVQGDGRIEWRSDVTPAIWDAALAALEGHPLQSALWGEARRASDGTRDHRIMALRDGQPVWMIRYEERRAGPLGCVAWAPRGPTPLLSLGTDSSFATALAARLRRSGIALLVTDGWCRAAEEGAGRRTRTRPQTFWIDLAQGRDAVWQRLDKQWRYGVGKARRFGVTVVRTRSEADLRAFFALCVDVSRLKDFRLPGSLLLMRSLLAPDRQGAVEAQIFLARHQDRLGAGAFVLRCGRSVHYMWGGMDRNFTRERVGEAVHWSVIEWALENGCTVYDLEGFDVSQNPGTFAFKKKMGGEKVTLIGREYYPFGVKGGLLAYLHSVKTRGFNIFRCRLGRAQISTPRDAD
jgi:chondroitin 4-sulfotransferase 11